MASHQAAHPLTGHAAQVHFYGSLSSGLVFALIAAFCIFGLVRTAHRRSKRDRVAASVVSLAPCLIASAYLCNAVLPLQPRHMISLLVPTRGVGSVLLVSGLVVALIGIGLMPTGEAGKWLPDKKEADSNKEVEVGVWPPAPKI